MTVMLSPKVVVRLKFLISSNAKMRFTCSGSLCKASYNLLVLEKNNFSSLMKMKPKSFMIHEANHVKNMQKFFYSVGVPLSSQEKYKSSLQNQRSNRLERRYYCFKEMGFTNINSTQIAKFESLMAMTVAELQAIGVLAHDVHPLDSLVSTVDGPPNLREIIQTKCSSLRDSSLKSIHNIIMLEYLSWRLQLNHEEIVPLFEKYKEFQYTSLSLMMQTYKILIEDLGFPMEKIKSNGFLLCLNPKDVLVKLNEFPTWANIPFTKLVQKVPKILCTPVNTLKKNEDILQHFGISPEQIMKCIRAVSLSSDTLFNRLRFLEEMPELKEMKTHASYLKLVYSFDAAVKRMEYLKANKFAFSLAVLYSSEDYFQRYVCTPEDRMLRKKLIAHLADYFKCNKKIIMLKLNNYHVDTKVNSVENVEKILEFLKENNFSKEDILNNISLLLLDYETVKSDFDSLASNLVGNKKYR